MTRLGVACGADPLTFAGLSGMGDLIVTCMSRHSRNRAVGEALAKGQTMAQIQAGSKMVAEGVRTTKSVWGLAEREGVDMPISRAVYETLYEGTNPMEAMLRLLTRDAKPER
jgi:glycerol-3-phosphate dehydrogenase (NAD(P)+)